MRMYVAECYTEKINAEFYINDIPLTIRGPGFGSSFIAPINQYLSNTSNEISVIIKPGDFPSRAKIGPITGSVLDYPGEDEKALMRICSYPEGAVVGGPEGEELASIVWPEKRTASKNIEINDYELNSYPLKKSELFDIGTIFKNPKNLRNLSKLKINEKLKFSIAMFLNQLHSAISAGDSDLFVQLTLSRIEDNANSYNKSIEENKNLIKAGLKENLKKKGWKLTDLDPQSYDLRLCFNDKLIHCISKDWKPVIREIPDKDETVGYYDIFVGLLNKKWQVLL